MALQMTGCNISYCPRDHTTFAPDLDWLEANLAGKKMLVLVNPCNPTGTVASKEELKAMSKLCTQHGVWFIVDNTYEYFVFDGAHHESIGGDHVLNVYSFSKAYGLMGWRVGYIAWQNDALTPQLMKVQDTVVICPARLSQVVALGAVAAGHEWCAERIRKLDTNREILFDAIRSYDPNALVGRHDGAIYAMVKVDGRVLACAVGGSVYIFDTAALWNTPAEATPKQVIQEDADDTIVELLFNPGNFADKAIEWWDTFVVATSHRLSLYQITKKTGQYDRTSTTTTDKAITSRSKYRIGRLGVDKLDGRCSVCN
ncbi:hypothetical protein PTSG_04447 [Salpingoeca rosetta]|uniref:Aminotransferase class I/classII large domain-containing protein n=1 Tax=Salpingoeca rosetta (strain ATCC 50818 / BSB-021) TaxID=946362 RepID=F2U8L1_SALR5|nr:uncharacterized protein PTSG_04447 [Salpingoeca rosetta]EGD72719.1 hypothetical protein PTSG_04447 [Salpingoeca rosetta]|eukprot:XP_004994542.1 hypothetical protein PTSG_04447 [Salpingoeca rosetta]